MITFSECITRINQVLNYPAFTYSDLAHFFDQAIAELNTTFRIGLPLVSTMVHERKIDVQGLPNLVLITDDPTGTPVDFPALPPSLEARDTTKAYYNFDNNRIYKFDTLSDKWVAYSEMYGIHIDDSNNRILYKSILMPLLSAAVWSRVDESRLNDFDLNVYLPDDWVILFLIPYVCFKVAVRDGASGSLYREEYVQGFQQLQTSYDVPNFVNLVDVAHLPAYTPCVKTGLQTNLNVQIPTRAVFDSMKIGNAVSPEYSARYTTKGGWGF